MGEGAEEGNAGLVTGGEEGEDGRGEFVPVDDGDDTVDLGEDDVVGFLGGDAEEPAGVVEVEVLGADQELEPMVEHVHPFPEHPVRVIDDLLVLPLEVLHQIPRWPLHLIPYVGGHQGTLVEGEVELGWVDHYVLLGREQFYFSEGQEDLHVLGFEFLGEFQEEGVLEQLGFVLGLVGEVEGEVAVVEPEVPAHFWRWKVGI